MIAGSLLLILVAVGLLVGGVVGGSNTLIVCCIVATVVAATVLVVGVKQSAGAQDAGAEDDLDDATGDLTGSRSAGYRGRDTRETVPRDVPRRRGDRADRGMFGARLDGDRVSTLVEEPIGRGSIPNQGAPDHYGADAPEERVDAHRVDAQRADAPRADAPRAEAQMADVRGQAQRVDAPVDVLDDDPPDEPSAQIVSPSAAARVAMLTSDVLVIDGRPRYHVTGCVHLLGRESEPLPVGEAVELGFTPCGLCEPDSKLLADARRV